MNPIKKAPLALLQSERARDERFWKRYKQFVDVSERACA